MPRATHCTAAALLIALAGLAATPALAQVKAKPVEEAKPGARPGKGEQKPDQKPDIKGEQKGDVKQPGKGEQRPMEIRSNGEGFQVVNPNDAPATPQATNPDELVTLSAFTDPVELTTLVDLVATSLQINIVIRGQLSGTVVFNAPVPVKKSELIGLLDMLLEQQNFTITQDRFGVWTVAPIGELKPVIAGETPTTRVFTTPNIRPSAIKPAIEAQGGASAGSPTRPFTYLDELGIIIATDTPRKLAAAEELINRIIEEFNKAQFIRLPLTHISAPVARERALQLVGQLAQPSRTGAGDQGGIPQQNMGVPGQTAAALNNMGDRLTVDPQGNAVIFRGLPSEIDAVKNILTIIDVRNALVPRQYFAGSAARQIADMARAQGLGEVTTIASMQDPFNQQFGGINQQFGGQNTNQAFAIGGPVMVVDESRGNIIYYGTPEQQERLDALIKELDTKSDRVTIEVYKVNDAKAVDVAEVIQNVISNTQPLGTSPLLPDGGGRSSPVIQIQNPQGGSGDGTGLSLDSGFVIADEANNQILVKAKAGQQAEFAKLIQKLDRRRLQVYIEAKIVAVTTDDRTRLAFETQLINANGTGGVLNTNFGLGSLGTTGGQPILNQKTVASGLSGFTAAIIKSDQVPIIMTALANETDSRVISSPQLLVDDNEEANVVSLDQQPYTTTTLVGGSTGGNNGNTNVTFGGYAEAGTKLKVKPQISDAGYLRLEYEIELSSFTGESNGSTPPPKQTNNIDSKSVTVPSDSTVVVGGLVVDTNGKTVAKIPLIGDIPLVGLLFSDTRKNDRQTRLYVFLTPRILRDPGFEDLRLLTQGPQAAAKVKADIPKLTPQSININQAATKLAPQPAPAPTKPEGVEERDVTPVEEE
ncbi:MAG TPA: secretin N-terminal domain-containing protein [Phycisphaerales bacterium]|nr:secretin N-terminal domain-containing protein [Phycisphaerales bacterium]